MNGDKKTAAGGCGRRLIMYYAALHFFGDIGHGFPERRQEFPDLRGILAFDPLFFLYLVDAVWTPMILS